MKSFFSSLALILFITLSGCSSEESPTNTTNTTGGSMTAKVDGQSWSADVSVMAVKSAAGITINAQRGLTDRQIIMLNLQGVTATGDYPLTMMGLGSSASFTTVNQAYATVDMNSGTLKVTKITDSEVAGTFNFTGKLAGGSGTKSVTDGNFSAKLTNATH